VDLLGKILGQAADFDLEEDVFEHAAAGFNPDGFADGLDRDHDGDLFVLGDLVQIDVQDLAGQGEVLDLLNEGQAFGGLFVDGQINQKILRGRVVDEIFQGLAIDLKVFGLGFRAVDDGR